MFYLVNAAWNVFKGLSTGIDAQTKVNAVTYIETHVARTRQNRYQYATLTSGARNVVRAGNLLETEYMLAA